MEKDKLEKYILDNRSGFDMYEPSPEVWSKITVGKSKLSKARPLWIRVSRYAAVVGIAFVLSFYLQSEFADSKTKDETNAPITNNNNEYQNIPEIAEAEAYYSTLVNNKTNEISLLTVNNPEVTQELEFDLNELEQIYFELREDLSDNADNEDVIEAMIQNYKTRVDILEDLLLILKNEKQNEKTNENNSFSL